jgi:hypothetical protein
VEGYQIEVLVGGLLQVGVEGGRRVGSWRGRLVLRRGGLRSRRGAVSDERRLSGVGGMK